MMRRIKNNLTLWHFTLPFVVLMAFTKDRILHFSWAIGFGALAIFILWGVQSGLKRIRNLTPAITTITSPHGVHPAHATAMNLYVIFLGSWFPDIDWQFGLHRSPLTHSIIPYLFMWATIAKFGSFGNSNWNRQLLCVFGFGLSSHLVTDIIPGGNVVSIPAWLDMPYLFVNGILVFLLSLNHQRSLTKPVKQSHL